MAKEYEFIYLMGIVILCSSGTIGFLQIIVKDYLYGSFNMLVFIITSMMLLKLQDLSLN